MKKYHWLLLIITAPMPLHQLYSSNGNEVEKVQDSIYQGTKTTLEVGSAFYAFCNWMNQSNFNKALVIGVGVSATCFGMHCIQKISDVLSDKKMLIVCPLGITALLLLSKAYELKAELEKIKKKLNKVNETLTEAKDEIKDTNNKLNILNTNQNTSLQESSVLYREVSQQGKILDEMNRMAEERYNASHPDKKNSSNTGENRKQKILHTGKNQYESERAKLLN